MVLPLLHQLNVFCADAIAKVVLTINKDEEVFHHDLGVQFPVELINNDSPKGFGSNHNQAFQHCDTPWFLVLNPDIELNDDVIGTLLAKALLTAGVIAPLVQESDEAVATIDREIITPWEVFVGQHLPRTPPSPPVWFPGMFMLFRSSAFSQVAGFDERFHMYCEDFEICARIRLSGWALQREPSTTIQHVAQRDSHERLQYLAWHVASLLRLWASKPFWVYWLHLRREPSGQTSLPIERH